MWDRCRWQKSLTFGGRSTPFCRQSSGSVKASETCGRQSRGDMRLHPTRFMVPICVAAPVHHAGQSLLTVLTGVLILCTRGTSLTYVSREGLVSEAERVKREYDPEGAIAASVLPSIEVRDVTRSAAGEIAGRIVLQPK